MAREEGTLDNIRAILGHDKGRPVPSAGGRCVLLVALVAFKPDGASLHDLEMTA